MTQNVIVWAEGVDYQTEPERLRARRCSFFDGCSAPQDFDSLPQELRRGKRKLRLHLQILNPLALGHSDNLLKQALCWSENSYNDRVLFWMVLFWMVLFWMVLRRNSHAFIAI